MVAQHDLIIRCAEIIDAPWIAAVRVAARRTAYRSFVPVAQLDDPHLEASETSRIERHIRSRSDRFRIDVAELNGSIAGYCVYSAGGAAQRGWIYDLFVRPDVWRAGIGRALLAQAVDFFVKTGCDEARLLVFEPNKGACAFYAANGWGPDGHRELSPELDVPALRYRVRLGKQA